MIEIRRPRSHRPRLASAVSVVALAVWVLTPSAALAAANAPCGNEDPNTHAYGLRDDPDGVSGAEARIDSIAPLLCTGDSVSGKGSFSYVSVEVTGDAIVQVGLAKCNDYDYLICDGNYRLFYAWGRENGVGHCTSNRNATPQSLGLAPSGLHKYTVAITASKVRFELDGTLIESIDISNVSCWTSSVTRMTVSGETWDKGDQMGGVPGLHQRFKNALYQESPGGPWLSPSFSVCGSGAPGIYQCSRVNGQQIDIWTDRS